MDINSIMKQAKAVQDKAAGLQAELNDKEYQASSGGDLVKVWLKGDGILSKIDIDPSLLTADEKEVLEDLIISAVNKAKKDSDGDREGQLKNLMGGLNLPPGMMGG